MFSLVAKEGGSGPPLTPHPAPAIPYMINTPKCVPPSWKGSLGGEEGRGSVWLPLNVMPVGVVRNHAGTQPFPAERALSPPLYLWLPCPTPAMSV